MHLPRPCSLAAPYTEYSGASGTRTLDTAPLSSPSTTSRMDSIACSLPPRIALASPSSSHGTKERLSLSPYLCPAPWDGPSLRPPSAPCRKRWPTSQMLPSRPTTGLHLIAWTPEPLHWTTSPLNPKTEGPRTDSPPTALASFTQAWRLRPPSTRVLRPTKCTNGRRVTRTCSLMTSSN